MPFAARIFRALRTFRGFPRGGGAGAAGLPGEGDGGAAGLPERGAVAPPPQPPRALLGHADQIGGAAGMAGRRQRGDEPALPRLGPAVEARPGPGRHEVEGGSGLMGRRFEKGEDVGLRHLTGWIRRNPILQDDWGSRGGAKKGEEGLRPLVSRKAAKRPQPARSLYGNDASEPQRPLMHDCHSLHCQS